MSVKLVWDCAMKFVIIKSRQDDNVAKCNTSRHILDWNEVRIKYLIVFIIFMRTVTSLVRHDICWYI